jgi:hypothetical protein
MPPYDSFSVFSSLLSFYRALQAPIRAGSSLIYQSCFAKPLLALLVMEAVFGAAAAAAALFTMPALSESCCSSNLFNPIVHFGPLIPAT